MENIQSGYIIRKIKKKDNPQLADIIRTVMTEYGAVGYGFSIEDEEVDNMFESYTCNRAEYYVIEKNNIVEGGAGIARLAGGDEDTCELKKMYFLPPARGKGFGNKLMDLCVDAAKKFEYKRIYLETLQRMPEARSLYEKYGFIQIDKPMGNTGHFNCECWYVKEI
jgi:putative acetyltransferase